jgi:uncharacterized repeat protein (TIGR02543 family)
LLVALAALVLGVTNAGGRSLAVSTVTVQVMGKGTVKSSDSKLKCGNGNTKCFLAFAGGETVTLTADAPSSWSFVGWDGAGCSGTGSCSIDTSGGDALVEADFTKPSGASTSTLSVNTTGSGEVSGDDATSAQIACGDTGTDCTWDVLTDSTVTIFETPTAGNVFSGWGGTCSGTGTVCTITMGGNESVSATWVDTSTTYVLTTTVKGAGKVSGAGFTCSGPGSCSRSEPANANISLKADPSDGYVFSGWSGGGCDGVGSTCTITMDSAKTVTATFSPLLSVSVNGNGTVIGGSGAINCGNGATICGAAFTQNSSVTLTATPLTGGSFLGWQGACSGTTTTCVVLMSSAKSVTATFGGGTAAGFSLSVSVVGNGTVTGGGINCGGGATTCTSPNHAAGSTANLTATPAAGATFTGWSGACAGTGTTCSLTFDASKNAIATFSGGSSGTFPLNVSVSGPGRVAGASISCGNGASACSATFSSGTTITLSATPASGAKFGGWGGSCSGTGPTCSVSMTAARSVSATFTAAGTPGTLTINVVGRGAVSSAAGSCASTGGAKKCVQRFKAGATATLTARPGAGQSFLGWTGACTGKATICKVKLSTALAVTATFSNRPVKTATLTSLGPPIVRKTSAGYRVTLRFATTVGGTARVRAVRAGRVVTTVSARVAAGRVRVGPFPVPLSGLYTFETRLAGDLLRMRACLGTCGAAAPPPPFLLVREPPVVTRSGDVWSVTLHVRANQIYDGRIRSSRAGRLLVNQHFLGRAGRVAFGPFLLGPGNYTIRLAALDAYGRARALTWIVSLI